MYTLFIDTHASLITVALYDGKNLLIQTQQSEYSHAVYLANMIKNILNDNSLTVLDIKNIVAVNGPGSFTGLRIGLSQAKTLAYSLNVPIYLISSLTCYLISDDRKCDKVCVMEDSKGFYVSVFDKDNNVLVSEQYVDSADDYLKYYSVRNELDVAKVIKYALNQSDVDVHLVRANYVKKIEVEK